MATRLRGGLRGAGFGAAGAAEQGFGEIVRRNANQQLAEQQRNQQALRELFKDYTDKVIAGTMEPEQAESAMRLQGYNVPKGYFDTVQPSVESEFKKIVGGIDKAPSFGEVPSGEAIAAMAPKRLKPYAGPALQNDPNVLSYGKTASPSQADTDPSTGDLLPTLPSTASQPTSSPMMAQLLAIREGKLASFPPTSVEHYNPASGANEQSFVASNPATLTGQTFQKTPTPTQAGVNQATSVTAGLRTALDQGQPELKGTAFNREEDVTRPAKVQTAAETSKATTQASLDVQTSPENIAKEARKQAAITAAVERTKNQIAEDGVPASIADSFLHTTSTGLPYAYLDASIPREIRTVAMKRIAANLPGARFLTKDQNDTLLQLENARGTLGTVLHSYESSLPKTADGRLIAGPANTLAMLFQSNPQLEATYKATFGPMIEVFRASTAGVKGFRMTAQEIARAQESIPLPTDTWDVAVRKAGILSDVFEDIEKQIAGVYTRKADGAK